MTQMLTFISSSSGFSENVPWVCLLDTYLFWSWRPPLISKIHLPLSTRPFSVL